MIRVEKTLRPIVVIDARMVTEIPHGFSRYVSHLARGLKKLKDSESLDYDPVFLVSPQGPKSAFDGFETFEMNAPFLGFRELSDIPKALLALRASLYHSPTFASLILCPCLFVITVHDLNHLHFGSVSKKFYYKTLLKSFVGRAETVLTVSEFSKKELVQWTQLRSDRFELAPNAVTLPEKCSPERVATVLKKYSLVSKQYFFTLSSPKRHKNIKTFLKGYEGYRKEEGRWPFVLNFAPPTHWSTSSEGLVVIDPLNSDEGDILLAEAGALVFPSLYEGFGLPPLEAAAMGVRVIVSKIAPHEEVLAEMGDGVAWVSPLDVSGWRQALHDLQAGRIKVSSTESREKLLSRFSEENLARRMDQTYRRVLGLGDL